MTAEKYEEIRQEAMEEFGFGPKVMQKIKVCAYCGAISPVENSFCGPCGKPLPKETVFQQYRKRHLYCADCDVVLPPGAAFCPKCGKKLQPYEPTCHADSLYQGAPTLP